MTGGSGAPPRVLGIGKGVKQMNLIPLTRKSFRKKVRVYPYGPKAGGLKPRNWDGTLEDYPE